MVIILDIIYNFLAQIIKTRNYSAISERSLWKNQYILFPMISIGIQSRDY